MFYLGTQMKLIPSARKPDPVLNSRETSVEYEVTPAGLQFLADYEESYRINREDRA